MRLKNITKLLISAHEKDLENQLWQQYALQYPGMNETTFVTFEDYKAKALGTTEKADKEAILKDAESIKAMDMSGRG